jgi:pimeloyl-ACP methyl ester carboxylesterase
VNGLGTLTNRVADSSSSSPANQPKQISHLRQNNLNDVGSSSLTMINNKPLHYKTLGADNGTPIVFIHGLGGSTESFTPLVHTLGLEYTHSMHLFDFEGHGLSPTTPLSVISIESLVADLQSLFEHANIHSGATIVAHSMGCIIAAKFALAHPDKVSKLILLGPPTLPFPEAGIDALRARAEIVRADGMVAVAGAIAAAGTSNYTQSSNPIAAAAVRLSLLGQDAEGYAKACTALASAEAIDYVQTGVKTLFVTGSEDGVAPPEVCEGYVGASGGTAELKVLKGVGHWHVFEDLQGVAAAVQGYL